MIKHNPKYKKLIEKYNLTSLRSIYDFCGEGEVVSKSATSAVWKRTLDTTTLYIKKYEYPKKSWRYFFRKSRAKQEYISYNFFQSLHLLSPEVLILAEKRVCGKLFWAIIITLELPNSQDLFYLYKEKKLEEKAGNLVMEKLASICSSLHKNNFFHRDLKLRNMLWNNSEIFLIDCPRGTKKIRLSYLFLISDLASLYNHVRIVCSQNQWMTFLEVYCKNMEFPIESLQHDIEKKTNKKYGIIEKK